MRERTLRRSGPGGPASQNREGPVTSQGWLRWWRSVGHASRFYWAAQAICALGVVFVTAYVRGSAGPAGEPIFSVGGVWLRATFDAIVLFTFTHLLIRPLLQTRFVDRRATTAAWGSLALLLLCCAVITALVAEAWATSSAYTPSVQEVRFRTGASEFGVTLVGWQLFTMEVLNALLTYVFWTAIYLGWKAAVARRELNRQVRQARLRQLTHQMGPHFLFNAFNSVRGLIYEDRDRAAELITRLSALMRAQLGENDETHHSVHKECQVARDYLEIEDARLEQRLSFSFDVHTDCEDFVLPAFTLLTVVENAIKHGIAPNPYPGWVRISARRGIQGWTLEVVNSYGAVSRVEGAGIGLKNLRERLLLSTNGEARIEYWKESESFHVRMDLPA